MLLYALIIYLSKDGNCNAEIHTPIATATAAMSKLEEQHHLPYQVQGLQLARRMRPSLLVCDLNTILEQMFEKVPPIILLGAQI